MESAWEELFPSTSDSTNYFAQNWLKELLSTKMAYLEGWSPTEMGNFSLGGQSPNYNIPLAFLSGGPNRESIQWEDVGPAGARWHGASKTPGGQWLKAPWHPTHWREDIAPLQEMFKRLGSK